MKLKKLSLKNLKKLKDKKENEVQRIVEEMFLRCVKIENEWRDQVTTSFLSWVNDERFVRALKPTVAYKCKQYTMDSNQLGVMFVVNGNKKTIQKKFPEILEWINTRFGNKTEILFYQLYLSKASGFNKYYIIGRFAKVTP